MSDGVNLNEPDNDGVTPLAHSEHWRPLDAAGGRQAVEIAVAGKPQWPGEAFAGVAEEACNDLG